MLRWQIDIQKYRGNMTIVHKDADGLRKCPLPNDIENPASVPEEASSKIPIEGINVTDFNTTFFEKVTPGQILCQLLVIDFTLHCASRQCQLSHVPHENVTQSSNPFQNYLQRLGIFTSLASASPMLSMLTRPHHHPDETLTLPPHLRHHHSLCFHTASLAILMLV
ncbi:hypothetical protein O181_063591 [Austropuccinia psidii MF-1]|uniref:Uncharacterized protein n=1 Tax=Austropuccinia psidii MF-1 TaxID=1389203 RepID=A0A9Q3EKB0_9BASI|nr:hypothetical protein [Austropuccinia psidii MF-1]